MITRSNGRVLALLVTVLVVGAAQAAPPVITPAPIPDFTDASCGFEVQVHFTTNEPTAKFFSDGTIIITGPLMATYSANGKSVSLNISGPAIIDPSGTFATAYGVQGGPTGLSNGEVKFGQFAGQVVVDFAAGTAVLVHGHLLLDICAALAP